MPLRLLIAVLLLAQALPALAAGFPACVRKRKGRYQEPPTLSALLRCQQILRGKHIALQKKRGFSLSAEDQDALEEFQRNEVRSYLGRHPGRATMDDGPHAAAPKKKKKKKDADPAQANPEQPGEALPSPDGKDPAAPPPETPSPAAVRGMIENLRMQLGDRPDLKELESAVETDGAALSPWTIRRLKALVRQAKSDGTELHLGLEAERWLLSD